MGSCAAPSAKGDDKFITTDYLQQCPYDWLEFVPGVVVAGLGLGITWRNNEVEKKALGMMAHAVTLASIVVITLATLLTHHYAEEGRGGFAYALAVLVDLALLGGVLVKVREQDLK
ncbi:hypothetical protein NMD68_12065 [Edwardsiella tarda]|uniref:hypothetical protein n=1 Tax=Edwardsiella tarda TaxID=636 RepID=UPI00351C2F2A